MIPNVVLAEDDPDLRQMMRELLEASGCRVLPAANGVAALRLLANAQAPRALLLDLSMPVMDGLEVLEHLASGPELPDTRIVVMTGGPTDRLALTGVRVLQKPVDHGLLLQALGVPHLARRSG